MAVVLRIFTFSALLSAASTARAAGEDASSAEDVTVHVRGDERPGPHASRRDATAASTVVEGDALQLPGASGAEVLSRVPGVQTAETGSSSDLATASVRGASSAETPVYLAGIRLNDDVTGTADLSTIPLWMLHRVEVFRGDTPYGADRLGLGGAIFFEPLRPRADSLRLGAAAGSYGSRSLWTSGTVRGAGSSALVALRRDSAQNDYGYVDDRGTRFDAGDDVPRRRVNADAASWDLWAIGEHDLGAGASALTLVNVFAREQGITGLSSAPATLARASTRRLLGAASASVPCAAQGDCVLAFNSSALVARSRIEDPEYELGLGSVRNESRGERVTQELRLDTSAGDVVRLGAGASFAQEWLRIDRAEGALLRAGRSTWRGAGTGSVALAERVQVLALGAAECHTTRLDGPGESCAVLEPAGRVGLRWLPVDAVELLGNVGRYARVPTLGELYGTSPLVRGNAALVPETGLDADLGLRAAYRGARSGAPSLWLDGSVFARLATELVAYRRASLGAIVPYNVGRARVLGVELAAGARPFDVLGLDGAVTLLDPRDTTPGRTLTNDYLPHRSRLVTTARVELASPPVARLAVQRATLGVRVSRRGSRYADDAGLIVLPGATTVDVDALVSLAGGRLALRAVLRDAFDVARFDAVGLPLAGRSFMASAELQAW